MAGLSRLLGLASIAVLASGPPAPASGAGPAGEAARSRAMAVMSVARSPALVTLLSPRSNAFWSSTPRRTRVRVAPRTRAVESTRAAPTSAMTAFVARLLERVIMRSISARTASRRPTSA